MTGSDISCSFLRYGKMANWWTIILLLSTLVTSEVKCVPLLPVVEVPAPVRKINNGNINGNALAKHNGVEVPGRMIKNGGSFFMKPYAKINHYGGQLSPLGNALLLYEHQNPRPSEEQLLRARSYFLKIQRQNLDGKVHVENSNDSPAMTKNEPGIFSEKSDSKDVRDSSGTSLDQNISASPPPEGRKEDKFSNSRNLPPETKPRLPDNFIASIAEGIEQGIKSITESKGASVANQIAEAAARGAAVGALVTRGQETEQTQKEKAIDLRERTSMVSDKGDANPVASGYYGIHNFGFIDNPFFQSVFNKFLKEKNASSDGHDQINLYGHHQDYGHHDDWNLNENGAKGGWGKRRDHHGLQRRYGDRSLNGYVGHYDDSHRNVDNNNGMGVEGTQDPENEVQGYQDQNNEGDGHMDSHWDNGDDVSWDRSADYDQNSNSKRDHNNGRRLIDDPRFWKCCQDNYDSRDLDDSGNDGGNRHDVTGNPRIRRFRNNMNRRVSNNRNQQFYPRIMNRGNPRLMNFRNRGYFNRGNYMMNKMKPKREQSISDIMKGFGKIPEGSFEGVRVMDDIQDNMMPKNRYPAPHRHLGFRDGGFSGKLDGGKEYMEGIDRNAVENSMQANAGLPDHKSIHLNFYQV